MSTKDEFYDPREPAELEAAILREVNDDYHGLLVAAARLFSEIRADVRLPFRFEISVDEWLKRVVRR